MHTDMIITSEAVFTASSEQPFEGFVAVSGNKITAVGEGKDFSKYADADTRILDMGECLIMPGLIEGHGHFSNGALFGSRYFISELLYSKSEAEAAEMVGDFAKKNPGIKRIIGNGWFPATWGDSALPSKHSLDAVVPDRPVYLSSADEHTVWMNSKAIEEAQVPSDKSIYLAKYIDKDPDGSPNGILHEEACLKYAQPFMYDTPLEIACEIEGQLINDLLANGITMFNDVSGITPGRSYKALETLEKNGDLKMRINIADGLDMGCDISHARSLDEKYHSPFLQQTSIKGVVDGVTSTFTGLLLEPYSDKPDTSGVPAYAYEDLRKAVIFANKEGYGVRLHCIGDKAVRWALDIFEESSEINDCTGLRNCVEHIESISSEDIERFGKLGVVASMQPRHLPLDANEQKSRLGEERWKTGWVFKSILEAGGILAFGTDFPVVPYDPFATIYYAVTRNGYDHRPTGCNPEQKLTVAETLKAYTYGSAYSCGREHELGTLEPGKLADIIAVDKNLFAVDPEEIPDAKVMMTVVDGKIVYKV